MEDFLKEWTETARIAESRISPEPVYKDSYAHIASGEDTLITYKLINPQNYELQGILDWKAGVPVEEGSGYTLAQETTDKVTNTRNVPVEVGSGYTLAQDAGDRSLFYLTLKNSFLETLDGKGTDISPTLTITEPRSGRNFGSYTVPLRVNSAPPAVSSPIILYNNMDNTYVICFNMPDMNTNSSIHRDIVSLTVSGFYDKTYTVTAPSDSNGNGITGVTNAYDDTNYKEVSGGGAFFGDKNNRFVGIETGVSLTAVPSPECTITLTDSSGLTSVVTASTEAPPLPAVTANPGSGTIEPGDLVTFNHATAGSTVTLTLSSTEGVTSSAGPFTENTVTFTGGGSGISLTFVKKGTYTVTATAGGVSGARDTTTTFTYTVPYSAVYISQNGSDSNGTGTPINPYATLDKAAEAIGNDGVVYVNGDVSVSGEYAHSSGTLTLRGYDGGGTLKNDSGRVLNITGGSVTLGEGITLTGKNTVSEGGAVYVAGGGNFTMEKGSTIADSIVQGTNAFGGGVAVKYGGAFTMNDGAKIIRCQAWDGGGAVYVFSSNFTMNGGVIGGNSAYTNVAKWGGGVYIGSDCEFTMSGNSEISYNMAEETGSSSTGIHGGGVCFSAIGESTFTMNGNARIIYNTCDGSGGGVHIENPGSRFFMNDNAQIKYNEAYNGGGVYFTGDGTFTVSGRPDITENILDDNSTNNVTLADGKVITIGGLTGGSIGVTAAAMGEGEVVQITDKNVNNAASIFTSDEKGYRIEENVNVSSGGTAVFLSDTETSYSTGGNGGVSLGDFNDAFKAIESTGGDITVFKPVEITEPTTIFPSSGVTIDITASGATTVFEVQDGGSLTLGGGDGEVNVSGDPSASSPTADGGEISLINISSGGTVTIEENANIQNNKAGRGVTVTDGRLIMTGGSIKGNTGGVHYGSGVYVSGQDASFEMSGGEISNNKLILGEKEHRQGAGVMVCNGATFTLSDSGKITDNSGYEGAGVTVSGSTFNMKGGEISKNEGMGTSGGVYLHSGATMNMNGGTITGNKAKRSSGAGGVFIGSSCDFTGSTDTTTASITGNTVGSSNVDVYLQPGGVGTYSPGNVQVGVKKP